MAEIAGRPGLAGTASLQSRHHVRDVGDAVRTSYSKRGDLGISAALDGADSKAQATQDLLALRVMRECMLEVVEELEDRWEEQSPDERLVLEHLERVLYGTGFAQSSRLLPRATLACCDSHHSSIDPVQHGAAVSEASLQAGSTELSLNSGEAPHMDITNGHELHTESEVTGAPSGASGELHEVDSRWYTLGLTRGDWETFLTQQLMSKQDLKDNAALSRCRQHLRKLVRDKLEGQVHLLDTVASRYLENSPGIEQSALQEQSALELSDADILANKAALLRAGLERRQRQVNQARLETICTGTQFLKDLQEASAALEDLLKFRLGHRTQMDCAEAEGACSSIDETCAKLSALELQVKRETYTPDIIAALSTIRKLLRSRRLEQEELLQQKREKLKRLETNERFREIAHEYHECLKELRSLQDARNCSVSPGFTPGPTTSVHDCASTPRVSFHGSYA